MSERISRYIRVLEESKDKALKKEASFELKKYIEKLEKENLRLVKEKFGKVESHGN